METNIQRIESQDSFEFGKANSRMKIYASTPDIMRGKIEMYRDLGMIDENGDPIVPKKQDGKQNKED